MPYRIEITPTALGALEAITDRRTRGAVVRRIDALAENLTKSESRCEAGWQGS